MKRRSFLRNASLGAGAIAVSGAPTHLASVSASPSPVAGVKPIVIVSKDKRNVTEKAMSILTKGGDALDAVIAGVNLVEEDPEDITVGYGGLPNENGVVELDASVMHGPSALAGAVAALQKIRYPSRVARLVMEQTDHVLLVGEGALAFARALGFPEENLLTEKARRIWLHWKQTLSDKDDWIPPPEAQWSQDVKDYVRTHGTIHCSAIDLNGGISAATSTSGLAWKMAGRVGDSALIGCGLYVDNDIGACGSTGRGEAVILSNGSHSVIDHLKHGATPEQAALNVLQWIVDHTKLPRWLDAGGRPNFDVTFYVLDKKGRHAGATIRSGPTYTVQHGAQSRTIECAYLFKKTPKT